MTRKQALNIAERALSTALFSFVGALTVTSDWKAVRVAAIGAALSFVKNLAAALSA